MRNYFFLLISLSFAVPSLSADFPRGKVVDLSHTFDEETIYWPTEEDFRLEKEADGMTEKGYYYAANRIHLAEHGGTHIDAPRHFAEGGHTVDEIPLEKLIGEGVLIDVSTFCAENRDYQIQVEDFLAWEKENGSLPEGAIVLLKTGFEKFWPDREKYMGTAERGKEAVAKLHSGRCPGLARGIWSSTCPGSQAPGEWRRSAAPTARCQTTERPTAA